MNVSPDETSGVLGMDVMVHHRVVVHPREQRLNINVPMEELGIIAGRRELEERTVVVEGTHSLVLRHDAMAAHVSSVSLPADASL